MASLNKVMLIGNLTRDADLRYTWASQPICEMRIASSRKTPEGESVIYTDVSLWGKRAEAVSKYLTKGKPLFVEGRLQLDEWDDKDTGQKRSKLKVVADNIEFLGGGRRDSEERPAAKPANVKQAAQDLEVDPGDIAF